MPHGTAILLAGAALLANTAAPPPSPRGLTNRRAAVGADTRDTIQRDTVQRGAARGDSARRAAALAPVTVSVTRDVARPTLDVPFAVSELRPDVDRPGQRHAALDEMLRAVPGVLAVNRNNPSQDPRISVRGFGARSAFGVRGVRVVRDGVPLTLPDGQTPVDYLDLESVDRIEVLRGTASALYGNAAGGVIALHTAAPPETPLAAFVRGGRGTFDTRRFTAAAGGRLGAVGYQANATRAEQQGFRAHARQRLSHGFARVGIEHASTRVALEWTGLDMPLAENPGALTAEQLAADPRQPDAQNVLKDARKVVRQQQGALIVARRVAGGELTATAHMGTRRVDNPQPFAIVDLRRHSGGASVRGSAPLTLLGARHRVSAGLDVERFRDDRRNFQNCIGVARTPAAAATCPVPGDERGIRVLDQREQVTALGPFARDEIEIGSRARLTLGARADRVAFAVDDRLISATNPDDSGVRVLHAVSPIVALAVRVAPLVSAYGSVSAAFETPTTTELANQPDGSAGLNESLQPQYATTYEIGAKGVASRLRYDVALFTTRVRDELVPYEVPGGGGRRYYRNAGSTRRRGVEASASTFTTPVEVGTAYTYSDFRFVDFQVGPNSYAGRRIPGVPPQLAQLYATWRAAPSSFVTVDVVSAGRVPADDANSASAASYTAVDVRAGGRLALGRSWLATTAGVQNLFDRRYAASVSVNAARSRFFEPAPSRTLFVTLSLGGP